MRSSVEIRGKQRAHFVTRREQRTKTSYSYCAVIFRLKCAVCSAMDHGVLSRLVAKYTTGERKRDFRTAVSVLLMPSVPNNKVDRVCEEAINPATVNLEKERPFCNPGFQGLLWLLRTQSRLQKNEQKIWYMQGDRLPKKLVRNQIVCDSKNYTRKLF